MYSSTAVPCGTFMVNSAPKRANGMTCTVIATTLFLSGTGSSFSVDDPTQWMSYVKPKIHQEFDLTKSVSVESESSDYGIWNNEIKDVEVRTIAQHLENIRNIMSPSMSELAKDLGVTRQALYKWVSGDFQPDNVENEEYIRILSKISDEFAKANVADVKNLVKVKAFDGKNLLDFVKSGGNWYSSVNILIAESRARQAEYENVMSQNKKSATSDDWKSYISIPGSDERG